MPRTSRRCANSWISTLCAGSREAGRTPYVDSRHQRPASSIRLPREMLNQLKALANKKDIPYQSLIKVYLADKIKAERKAG